MGDRFLWIVLRLFQHPNIKILFALSVRVERAELRDGSVVIKIAMLTKPISSRTAGVQERNVKAGANHPKGAGVFQVQFIKDLDVLFCSVCSGAKMYHGIHVRVVAFEPTHKIEPVHLAPKLFSFEVSVFIRTVKIIYRQYIGVSSIVEPFNHAGTYEACSACNYDHIFLVICFMVIWWIGDLVMWATDQWSNWR